METPPRESRPALRQRIGDLLHRRQGPLTGELQLAPGQFGLGQVPAARLPDATTSTVCGFCSTGCGLTVHLKDGQAVGLTPATHYPVNLGRACPKGWEALAVLDAPDRATTPLLRDGSGKLVPVDWDTALRTFVARFGVIQQTHGPDAVAFLSTGQIVTEEMALLGALAKFGMGIVHGDGNTRQCMATAVVAHKESFGFDAPPYTYLDLEESDVIVLAGSNLCIAHPILWERICRNRHSPHIIAIDPRKTETAMAAATHLPLRPKSDLHLFYGLAHLLIREGWIDRAFIDAHTSGFDEFTRHVAPYTPALVSEQTGIGEATLHHVARTIHQGKRVSLWWTMGVNQSYEGVRVAQAIINLALMTGNIGRPGTGANSITGQCNAMGSRLFSNTTNLFGGRSFESDQDRREVAGILGIEPQLIPSRNSWAYDQIVDAIATGQVKGLWVIGTNPAHSWIGQNDFHRLLEKLEFLVVQDMYHSTETAVRASLLLPAAAWGEKDGTFINSERRIGVTKKVAAAPGQALADFHIFQLIAEYWGCGALFREWDSPAAVFEILKRLSAHRPCDITGIRDYRMLDESGGIQWPYGAADAAAGPPTQERRLLEDGRFFHADGRARFCFEPPHRMPEPPSAEYPFLLLTGRGTAAQWHTQTRTSKSAVLRKLYPQQAYVEISPDDARALQIEPDEWVMIASQRGSICARAFITPCICPGQVFIPMHYEGTNRLTVPVFDPYSRQPSYKACAVRLRKIAPWEAGA